MSPLPAIAPTWLRVAVAASDTATRSRLAALVIQSGHELVEMAAFPDAVLTDGAADGASPASAVSLGAIDEGFAGLLPPDATAAQVDAALRAVAAGLTVRAPIQQSRNFGPLPEEP